MRDAFIPNFGSPCEINVGNGSEASRRRFLATIKDETAQKYTGTNVSFKVRIGYVLSSADTAGTHASLSLFPPSLAPTLGRVLSSSSSMVPRANHVSRQTYVINVNVARSKR